MCWWQDLSPTTCEKLLSRYVQATAKYYILLVASMCNSTALHLRGEGGGRHREVGSVVGCRDYSIYLPPCPLMPMRVTFYIEQAPSFRLHAFSLAASQPRSLDRVRRRRRKRQEKVVALWRHCSSFARGAVILTILYIQGFVCEIKRRRALLLHVLQSKATHESYI